MLEMMKAVTFHEHGDISVLRYEDIPVPKIAADEVLVKMRAIGTNRNDLWAREGLPGVRFDLPHISGSDLAGDVVAVGNVVRNAKVGDAVLIHPGISCRTCAACTSGHEYFCRQFKIYGFQTGPLDGAYAEYAKLPAVNVIPKPENLSYEEAAGIGLALLTVWHMLVTRANLRAGEDILIWGAGSGIGVVGIQLAKVLGARVIATAGTDEKVKRACELGADVGINHHEDDVVKVVRDLTKRKGVEVVFEHVGQATWERSVQAMAWGGRLVICGNTTGWEGKTDLRFLFNKQLSILGSHQGSKAELMEALEFVKRGQIRSIVDSVVPLCDATRAHEMMYQGNHFGKIVLVP